jgi:hypothetical protein
MSPPCNRCGGELIRKNRWRLFIVGVFMVASVGTAAFLPLLLLPSMALALVGVYLIVWATVGRGLWCRQCKSFRGGISAAVGR